MRSKISLKWSLLILSSVGIAFCSIIILFLNLGLTGQGSYERPISSPGNQSIQNSANSKPVESIRKVAGLAQSNSILTIRLNIPKINVNSAIESVGITSDGAMGAPKGPANAAWYNLGPRPGEAGSAVIDGHSGWFNGIPAVFDNLNKLQKGDKLYIEDKTGTITTFVVRESRSYDPAADASEVFSSNDEKVHLNLITCEGTWSNTEKSYSNRLVVFTDRELD